MTNCRRCDGTGEEPDGLSEEVERLRNWCQDTGHWISPDGRVKAIAAAKILGQSPNTIRTWRYQSTGPAFYRRGRGAVTYRLEDLAEELENMRFS